jgi:hypothetical protein
VERKRLEDYRSEDPVPAADTCECGEPFDIMLFNLDVEQQTGIARIWATHRETCATFEEALTSAEPGVRREEEDQTAGWGWRQETMALLGVVYPLYEWFLDVMPCLACWKLIVGVPLLLFGSQGVLAFCHTCFQARGLGPFLQIGRRREGAEDDVGDGPSSND